MATEYADGCDCIERIDKLIEANGVQLVWDALAGCDRRLYVAVEGWDTLKPRPALNIAAKFCPFCGIRYGRAPMEVNDD